MMQTIVQTIIKRYRNDQFNLSQFNLSQFNLSLGNLSLGNLSLGIACYDRLLGGHMRIVRFGVALMLLAIGLAGVQVQAAQYRIGGDDTALAAVVSSHEITRIALRGDRITGVVVRPMGFVIEHDAKAGDMFITPAQDGLPDQPINLFISSEAGHSYQLLLTPMDVPAEQIIIIGRVPATAGHKAHAPRREMLAGLMRAMITGQFLDGYLRQAPVLADLDHIPARLTDIEIVSAWQGDRFRGLDILIHTASRSADVADRLDAMDRLAPDAAAVWIAADGTRAIVIIEHGDEGASW